jgi:hypothetical protein
MISAKRINGEEQGVPVCIEGGRLEVGEKVAPGFGGGREGVKRGPRPLDGLRVDAKAVLDPVLKGLGADGRGDSDDAGGKDKLKWQR